MSRASCLLTVTLLVAACASGEPEVESEDLRPVAEDFFTGVFGCEPELLAQTAAEDVAVSYPIFESLFGTPAIRGRDAVQDFSSGFCSRWLEPTITVHEALQDGNRVVLVWDFSATPQIADSVNSGGVARESWGGISFFRFDAEGRVIEEMGEESTPGPVARLVQQSVR